MSNNWRSIKTAPKDGTLIDVWKKGEFPRRIPDVSWREPTESDWGGSWWGSIEEY